MVGGVSPSQGLGNQVLSDSPGFYPYGRSALSRFDRDALGQPGVTDVLLVEGLNDLGNHPELTAERLIEGLTELIMRAKHAGVRVHLGTLTPTGGTSRPHGSAGTAERRHAVNTWILEQKLADSVFDFYGAVRDPEDPDRLAAAYDSGDHLHPNAAGYAALADAIQLSDLVVRRGTDPDVSE